MVKKFSFRLVRLQKLRERVRDQRQLAHAQAVDYQVRVQEQIQSLETHQDEQKQKLTGELSQASFSVETAIHYRNYDAVLLGLKVQLDRQLEQVRHVVSVRQSDLMNAERDVRILEKLEGRAKQRYQEEMDRAETVVLDELASSQNLRASREKI